MPSAKRRSRPNNWRLSAARPTQRQRALYEGEFQASGGLGAVGSDEGAWELGLLTDYAQFSRPGLGEDGGVAGRPGLP